MSQFFRPFLSSFLLSILFVLLCCLSVPVFAQKPIWRYVQTIYGGAKLYLNDEVQILPGNHRVVWDKRLSPTGGFAITKVEWDCRLKKSLALEMTLYDADRIVLGTKRNFDWQSIIPGSVSDAMFRQICFEKSPAQYAEIIAAQANLRSFPDGNADILRTAKQGSRFLLVPDTGQGGWYNIADERTQQDYWIDGNLIKIIEAETTELTKPRKTPKQPANKRLTGRSKKQK